MGINRLLTRHVESIYRYTPQHFHVGDSYELESRMTELDVHIHMCKIIHESISQNTINIAHALGEDPEKFIRDREGNVIKLREDMNPTIQDGDDIGMKVASDIIEQEQQIFDNVAGLLHYKDSSEFKKDLGYNQEFITTESIRISPISSLRFHNEKLGEIFIKIINAIKHGIKWIMDRVKDFGYSVLNVIETFLNRSEKLLKVFESKKDENKKLKKNAEFSDSTILTLMVDMTENLKAVHALQFRVLGPYSKAYHNLLKERELFSGSPKGNDVISRAREDLLKNKFSEGEHFLKKIGFKNINDFIMLSRPDQIISLDVETNGLWEIRKTDIELNKSAKAKLMSGAQVDELWVKCIDYLKSIPMIKKMAKDMEDKIRISQEDISIVALIDKSARSGDLSDVGVFLRAIYQLVSLKKTVIGAFYSIPRAINSACLDLLKNVDVISQADYTEQGLPKPSQEFFGPFKKKTPEPATKDK